MPTSTIVAQTLQSHHFLIGFTSPFYKMKLILHSIIKSRISCQIEEIVVIILINGNGAQQIPDDLSLYPQIDSSLNFCQRGFHLQYIMITNGHMTENKKLKNVLSLVEHVYGSLSSQGSEITVEERQEQYKSWKCQVTMKTWEASGESTYELTHNGCTADFVSITQTRPQNEDFGNKTSPISHGEIGN